MMDEPSQQDLAVATATAQVVSLLRPLAQRWGARAVRVAAEKAMIEVRRQLFPLAETIEH